MKIKIVPFGIAKEIMQGSNITLDLDVSASIADLKKILKEEYPDLERLNSLKFAINENYEADHFQMQEGDEVVIIPPVSGG